MKDTALAIEERLHWECRANGKPKPSYAWLKNGQQLLSGVNHSLSSATYQHFILKTKSAASAHLPPSFQHAARSRSLIFFFQGAVSKVGAQTSRCRWKRLSAGSTLADYAVLESGSVRLPRDCSVSSEQSRRLLFIIHAGCFMLRQIYAQ